MNELDKIKTLIMIGFKTTDVAKQVGRSSSYVRQVCYKHNLDFNKKPNKRDDEDVLSKRPDPFTVAKKRMQSL